MTTGSENFNMTKWHKTSLPVAQLFFQEGEKRLKDSIDSYQRSKDVAHRILTVVLPIITITSGYTFTQINAPAWPLLGLLFWEVAGVIFLIMAIKSQPMQSFGTQPINLWTDDMIASEDAMYQHIGILLNLSESMQLKINHNLAQNHKTVRRINIALSFCGIVAPIFSLMIFLVYRYQETVLHLYSR